MNDKDYMYEELSDFLDGTFHQDMGTAEKALNEFIEEAHKVCIENTIKYITEFLKSDLSTQEKEEFIKDYTEVYFPSLKLTPIEWLEQTVETLKQALKNN
ncbi:MULTISPECIES: contact-dependent growth inhibition system immunity protein [Bacillus]|uniref:contact-dependent growth inhibition system immunity protein n=1 Tax=Bacillus TaxID=1386 RepID=UPI0004696E1C|nr:MULTISPECIES: contact-dependent growth inhibition system immunity protein [Bacillus]MED0962092.1 contact-dependent growth inhibition system immunity protein [Bacillus paramycoides]MED1410142.1 contact-dependent growth inhibition system immunity protein [Bacillus paramycoides]MED1464776.1 contact-dependent growth inhibition system immunity protein [Bacillus paramycoides]MED1493303.1 contact-dependent growth inhibition system immunity protein [Bacillus paramycoides]